MAHFAFFTEEVAERIDGAGCPVIVGSEDERAGAVHQWAECAEDVGDCFFIAKVVTGVDHQIGA